MSRTVGVVTGTRAEYGLLRGAMKRIEAHDELTLQVVVTGMHLSERHGRTVTEIEDDGFDIDRRVHMQVDGDSGRAMAKSLGVGLSGMADALADLDPDIVLVLGDRGEALAGGVAAAHMNLPVAHIHGGDAMEGAIIDDSIRHALTKFAHVHFPVSEQSAERIEKLGEEPWRITTVGAPGLDEIREAAVTAPETLYETYGLDPGRPLLLTVQHPVTTAPERAGEQMRATLDALAARERAQVVVIYPNADAGGGRMIDAIESHDAADRFHAFESLPRADYLGLLDAADALVGNSSSGIIEAPSFGLPVVDVGPRQTGRQRADNTLSVPHETQAIEAAIERCLTDESFQARARNCENPYDYGGAAERIVSRLAEIDLTDRLIEKRLTY
ncbi:UDP-N-acetylglucosamine 2-epimerase (hydrolyzing) [Halomicroarcula sp. F28]|uniref:UDP-N-acetylglucosamine 2-epimerase n=1 Tax=Haloarcula salinisoli TaxID=2487746 RepID=UPI001C731A16|nr:UDP-N-acetylglucosamine 2-epimerase [Halomicroarcula salinisoli]MBX0288254.1 UDP-N-acetylglucosamine 2-epimerase (hydrolyzing) [Halomicroarcula salinisoli]